MYAFSKSLLVSQRISCSTTFNSGRYSTIGMKKPPPPTTTTSRRMMMMMMMSSTETQRTLGPGSHISEMEVKKSRFIGYAKHVSTWENAQEYIEQVKMEHPKARHWCYGFRGGYNPVSERCSDDGEPTGTAGLPILGKNQKVRIQKEDEKINCWFINQYASGYFGQKNSNSLFSILCLLESTIGAINGEGLSDTVCVVVRYFGEFF